MTAEWSAPPPVRIEENLYDFSAGGSYLALIRNIPPENDHIMLIGHNPTMEMLAAHLAGQGDAEALDKMEVKYPTCALAELEFDIGSWTDVREAGGFLRRFIVPREISE